MEKFDLTRALVALVFISGGLLQRYHEFLYRRVKRRYEYEGNRLFLGILTYIYTLLIGAYVLFPHSLSRATFPILTNLIKIGHYCLVLSLILWIWSQLSLGKYWSGKVGVVAEKPVLVKTGPYRWIRHPMYTAYIFLGTGLLLSTHNWLVAGPFILYETFIISRAWREEHVQWLVHGEAYESYKRRTWMFLPFIWQIALLALAKYAWAFPFPEVLDDLKTSWYKE